jgi:L-malate glycosyltransferase
MNILMLSDANSVHTQKWAISLQKEGYNVRLFSLFKPNDEIIKDYYNYGIKIDFLDLRKKIKDLRKPNVSKLIYLRGLPLLCKVIKSFSPDIIHAHYISSYGILALLTRFRPIIISVWGSDLYDFPNKNILNKLIINKIIKSADAICSTSKAMQNILINDYSYKKSYLIPFGVDTDRFYPLKSKNKNFIVGTIKSIESHNGIDCLINAANIVVNLWNYSNIKFLIVGGGTLKQKMQDKCKELNLENSISFEGFISHKNIIDQFQKLSLFIAVSTRESFGVSILEAASCGVPAITSNIGGLPEVNTNNQTGFIIPPDNELILAEKIVKLFEDKSLRFIMSKNARENTIKNFNWKKNVDDMIKIYRSFK